MSAPRAVVVGAGPAGTSAALGLLRAGFEVSVLEQRTAWRDRVCGGFVNPEGVRHLAELGLLDAVLTAGGSWVRDVLVCSARGGSASVPVVRDGTPGLGISRRALEDVLVHAVRAMGGEMRFGCRVVGVERAGAGWTVTTRTGQEPAQASAADLVVLAGGRFWGVRRDAAEPPRDGWFGWNATFDDVPQPPGSLSMHFHADGYVGVLTFADGSANVCGLSRLRDGHAGSWDAVWDATLGAQRSLADCVATARRVSPWHGVGPLPFSRRMRRSEGPLLAGDAAAVGDPYMGEGISRALGTGGLVRGAIEACGPPLDAARIAREYARRWRRRYTPRLILGSLTRYVQRRPAIFGSVLQQAIAHPSAARLLLRVCHPVAGLTRPGEGGSDARNGRQSGA